MVGPLRYLIGGNDNYRGAEGEFVELSYDAERPPPLGIGVKYGNLFNEKYSEQTPAEKARYAPYLEQGDTAEEYGEGQIDPAGQGWNRNLDEQFERAKRQGFTVIELDNPDSYAMSDVIAAVDRAHAAGLQVLAKNPSICKGNQQEYVAHPAVVGVVVEKNCGVPFTMDDLRQQAGKPDLPVWFVAFSGGRSWAERTAVQAENYHNMGVTYSEHGEYRDSTDILVPKPPPDAPPDVSSEVPTVDITTTGTVKIRLNGEDVG